MVEDSHGADRSFFPGWGHPPLTNPHEIMCREDEEFL